MLPRLSSRSLTAWSELSTMVAWVPSIKEKTGLPTVSQVWVLTSSIYLGLTRIPLPTSSSASAGSLWA